MGPAPRGSLGIKIEKHIKGISNENKAVTPPHSITVKVMGADNNWGPQTKIITHNAPVDSSHVLVSDCS